MSTPALIADQMEQWLEERASDGFNVISPIVPEGLNDFVDRVVPELQCRCLLPTKYEASHSGRIWGWHAR